MVDAGRLGGGTLSLDEVIASQEQLEEEAAEAIPFSFSTCTWSGLDEVRQPVYSCLTCRPSPLQDDDRGGICAGCSVSCHGQCELVELFNRRDFTCDCGTAKFEGKSEAVRRCTLTLREGEQYSERNRYDKNFDGRFCKCDIQYDPETEEDEMVQCLVCEDWYHADKCLSPPIDGSDPSTSSSTSRQLDVDAFESLVCERCATTVVSATVGRYAGQPGFMLLDKDGHFIGLPPEHNGEAKSPENAGDSAPLPNDASAMAANGSEVSAETGSKRGASPGSPQAAPEAKRPRVNGEESGRACTAPPKENPIFTDNKNLAGRNVFLAEGWRERWCRCEDCMPLFSSLPYLLHEESTYEPPSDPSSSRSLLELGTEALSEMPREQAIQGLQAYGSMRDRLKVFLEPFAREGRVVGEGDIKAFFESQKEGGQ